MQLCLAIAKKTSKAASIPSLLCAVQLAATGLLDGNQVTGTDSSREPNIIVWHGGVNFRF
jgi:hypothetical protein